jgi:hypothetical protein
LKTEETGAEELWLPFFLPPAPSRFLTSPPHSLERAKKEITLGVVTQQGHIPYRSTLLTSLVPDAVTVIIGSLETL